jgi:hypothetical protein
MAPTRTRKRTAKALESTLLNPPISTITLGEEEPLIAPLNLTFTVESAYPLEPLISNDTSTETQEDAIQSSSERREVDLDGGNDRTASRKWQW